MILWYMYSYSTHPPRHSFFLLLTFYYIPLSTTYYLYNIYTTDHATNVLYGDVFMTFKNN